MGSAGKTRGNNGGRLHIRDINAGIMEEDQRCFSETFCTRL